MCVEVKAKINLFAAKINLLFAMLSSLLGNQNLRISTWELSFCVAVEAEKNDMCFGLLHRIWLGIFETRIFNLPFFVEIIRDVVIIIGQKKFANIDLRTVVLRYCWNGKKLIVFAPATSDLVKQTFLKFFELQNESGVCRKNPETPQI